MAEVKPAETEQILDARVGRRAPRMVEIIMGIRMAVGAVSNGPVSRLTNAAVRHPERCEHLIPHEVGIRLSGRPLDDVVEETVAYV